MNRKRCNSELFAKRNIVCSFIQCLSVVLCRRLYIGIYKRENRSIQLLPGRCFARACASESRCWSGSVYGVGISSRFRAFGREGIWCRRLYIGIYKRENRSIHLVPGRCFARECAGDSRCWSGSVYGVGISSWFRAFGYR